MTAMKTKKAARTKAAAKSPTKAATKAATKPKRGSTASPVSESPKKLSALSAAARVLQETGTAMSCPEMVEAMAAKGYWTSPAGKTPAATLNTAVTMLPKCAPGGAVSKRAW